uniref:(northern house mosquito) hypothetical protein n=1 Tax=Culex pipiens TaxID=7175 RepID=A0A8D8CYD4_CULPI
MHKTLPQRTAHNFHPLSLHKTLKKFVNHSRFNQRTKKNSKISPTVFTARLEPPPRALVQLLILRASPQRCAGHCESVRVLGTSFGSGTTTCSALSGLCLEVVLGLPIAFIIYISNINTHITPRLALSRTVLSRSRTRTHSLFIYPGVTTVVLSRSQTSSSSCESADRIFLEGFATISSSPLN